MSQVLTPEIVISAYTQGYFPMADDNDGEIFWHCPDPRAVIPLELVKEPKTLIKKIKKENFTFGIDKNFEYVIRACSQRPNTWISNEIIEVYTKLHKMNYAHSVECYFQGVVVGGLYGIALGGAFFGESMFSTVSDSSKAAFFHLTQHLKQRGFILLDSQYINPFTVQLGAIEIPKNEYFKILNQAISLNVKF